MTRDKAGASRHSRCLAACLIALLPLAATACTETSDLVIDAGTAIPVVADPDLVSQGLTDAELRIQVAEWSVEKLELFFGDDPEAHDMKFSRTCKFVSTAVAPSVSHDKCASGIVLDAGDGSPVPVTLHMRFTMDMRRGKPKELNPSLDDDGDGIVNARDICPYVYDPGQEDVDRNLIGDACALNGAPDTDGDGSRDGIDNCLWDANPDQANTTGVSADGISDAIGDACMEQVAVVTDRATGDRVIDVTLDLGEVADLGDRIAFLVVDFSSRTSITCTWSDGVTGACELDTSKIKGCVTTGTAHCN